MAAGAGFVRREDRHANSTELKFGGRNVFLGKTVSGVSLCGPVVRVRFLW